MTRFTKQISIVPWIITWKDLQLGPMQRPKLRCEAQKANHKRERERSQKYLNVGQCQKVLWKLCDIELFSFLCLLSYQCYRDFFTYFTICSEFTKRLFLYHAGFGPLFVSWCNNNLFSWLNLVLSPDSLFPWRLNRALNNLIFSIQLRLIQKLFFYWIKIFCTSRNILKVKRNSVKRF